MVVDFAGRGLGVWTVVYIAPSRKDAEKIQQILTSEGFLVKLRTIGVVGSRKNKKNSDAASVEILVPEAEVDEALEVINTAV